MDKSDGDSSYSDPSEDQSSNISTLSSLSDYKNEFLQLKQLIDPNKCSKLIKSPSKFDDDTVEHLQNELKKCRKFNETYRIESQQLRRITEIKYNEKIETLIKQNKELEDNLEYANTQIQRLLDTIPLKKNCSEATIVVLEKENHNLNVEKSLLNDQIAYYKQQINDLLLENDDYRRKFSETSLELKTRISCVEELKEKIAQQFLDLQNLQKDNQNLTQTITNLLNDLEYLRKLEIWYKKQLQNYQNEKQKLMNEIHDLKQINIANIERIDYLHLEITKWQCKYDEIQLESAKEKEEILLKFETINNSSDSGFINEQYDSSYETIVKDLNDEIQSIISRISEDRLNLEKVNKENSELLSKCLLLEKDQQRKESEIERFINDEKSLKTQLSMSLDREKTLQKEIDDLRNTTKSLQLDLLKKNEQNSQIDDSIKTIKEQFRTLKSDYEKSKSELNKLLKENLQLQNDKQELFMSYNWKICELDEYKNLETEIKQLQEKLLISIQENHQIQHENVKLINENADLSRLLNEKTDSLMLLEGTVGALKQQILQQDRNFGYKNHLDIIENLKKICELFKIDCKIDSTSTSQSIGILLEKIEEHCRDLIGKRNNLTQLFNRIKILQKRCLELQKRTDNNFELLQGANYQMSDGQVKHLQMMLEVKNREQKDKQQRYEKNYSVLLRKVKEQMKYRNLAEKHQKFLHEMNESISNECNDLKMLIEAKNYEIQQLQTAVENYKQSMLNLEKKINKNDSELVTKQLEQTEKLLKQHEIDDEIIKNEMKEKDLKIESLNQMNQSLISELSEQKRNNDVKILKDTIANLLNEIKNLQSQLNQIVTTRDELAAQLDDKNSNYQRLLEENQQLTHDLDDYRDKNDGLTTELKLMQSDLQQKSEEFTELQLIYRESEESYSKEIDRLQNTIFNLKTQLQTYTSDIDLLKNQKFFLQRLCNDLKLALRFHVNHCKVLQEKLMDSDRNQSESCLISLPEIPINSQKYSDAYIEKLLEKSQLLNKENYLVDVKSSLDGLRNEISLLQKHLNCT